MEELWLPIREYEGLYEVSNQGNVRSVERFVPVVNNGTETTKIVGAKLMTVNYPKNGYGNVHLYKNGQSKYYSVHRLVAEAFIENPLNKPVVHHIDGNKHNNVVSNLAWATVQENVDAVPKELILGHTRPKPVRCVETGVEFVSASDAANTLGLKASYRIRKSCYDNRITVGGYHWEYSNADDYESRPVGDTQIFASYPEPPEYDPSSEMWAPLDSYDGKYYISTYGRIFNIRKGFYCKQRLGSKKYLMVNLYQNGKSETVHVHRLVASTFLPNRDNAPCVNHIDENKWNNSVYNLEWVSYIENSNHGTAPLRISEMKKRPVRCVETGKVFNSIQDAANSFGKNRSHIGSCCSGVRKTAFGYHWEFV